MEQHEALTKFAQVIEQVNYANARIRQYTHDEPNAAKVEHWQDVRSQSAQAGVDALVKAVLG